MGNSPSKSSQYAIQSTNKPSQSSGTQQQLQVSEESSNEPNDPDDSRSLPTNVNISISKRGNNNGLMTSKMSGQVRKSAYQDWKLDINVAKALQSVWMTSTDSSASVSLCSTSSSVSTTTSSYSFNIPLKQGSGDTLSSSYADPGAPMTLKNGPLPASYDPCSLLGTNAIGCGLPTIVETAEYQNDVDVGSGSLLLRRGVSNPRSPNPIILKRNSHDPHNTELLNIDDVIEKLLHIAETRIYYSHDFPFYSWEIQLICSAARESLLEQPSLLKLQAPIKIVGDLHGQFFDMFRILKLSGIPHDTNYLFLGDYVDRGKQSLETILLLLCYKIKYPDRFFMLRGNHESANVTKMYGFYDECKRRMSTKTWKHFVDVFNTLPFAAIVQDKIFCVHGGISPQLTTMKQIEKIARPTDIPEEGLLTDLLWSDPDSSVSDWSLNDRGVSYTFSKRNVYDFCSKFKLDLIIRGHMVVEDGYEFFAKKKFVTIFSAPNYCGQFQNWGAVMSVTTGMMCSFELLKPHGLK